MFTQYPATQTSLKSKSSISQRRWLRFLAAVLLLTMSGVYGCMAMETPPPNLDYSTTRTSEQGKFRATFSSAVTPIPINELHNWTLHIETPDGKKVTDANVQVKGDMPQHGHGMPTQPRVTQNLGNGDYLVEGMKFQMGGWWVIEFDIATADRNDAVKFNLQLQQ